MKKYTILSRLLALAVMALPALTYAGTSLQASTAPQTPTSTPVEQQAWKPQAVFTLSDGSLKNNIQRAAKQFGWNKLVWLPKQDYKWVGQTKITASGLTELLTKVLENYPLQAVFYEGNHVLVITSRNIR